MAFARCRESQRGGRPRHPLLRKVPTAAEQQRRERGRREGRGRMRMEGRGGEGRKEDEKEARMLQHHACACSSVAVGINIPSLPPASSQLLDPSYGGGVGNSSFDSTDHCSVTVGGGGWGWCTRRVRLRANYITTGGHLTASSHKHHILYVLYSSNYNCEVFQRLTKNLQRSADAAQRLMI